MQTYYTPPFPWQMVVAHEWNANTGKVVARGTWNPLKGGQGE